MNYGKAIRTIRAARGLSQSELGSRISADASFISRIEAGKRKPSLDTIEKITAELGVPVPVFMLLAADSKTVRHLPASGGEKLGRDLLRVLVEATDAQRP